MNKADLTRELEKLLDELFTPTISEKPDNVKKGGSVK